MLLTKECKQAVFILRVVRPANIAYACLTKQSAANIVYCIKAPTLYLVRERNCLLLPQLLMTYTASGNLTAMSPDCVIYLTQGSDGYWS